MNCMVLEANEVWKISGCRCWSSLLKRVPMYRGRTHCWRYFHRGADPWSPHHIISVPFSMSLQTDSKGHGLPHSVDLHSAYASMASCFLIDHWVQRAYRGYSAGSYQWNSFPWFHQCILPFHSFQLLERGNISYCFEREECEHSSAGILKVQSFWQSNYRDSIMPHNSHLIDVHNLRQKGDNKENPPQPFNKAKCFNNSSYSKLISKE